MAVDNLRKIIRLARLTNDHELLEWARRLVNDLNRILDEMLEEIATAMSGGGTPAAHNLLSTTHPDTTTASPVKGDIIIANAPPFGTATWERLAKGSAGQLLVSGFSIPGWVDISTVLPSNIAYTDQANTFTLEQIFQSFLDLESTTLSSNPAAGTMRVYVNVTGSTAELRVRASDGTECVLCSKTIGAFAPTLPLNWVE